MKFTPYSYYSHTKTALKVVINFRLMRRASFLAGWIFLSSTPTETNNGDNGGMQALVMCYLVSSRLYLQAFSRVAMRWRTDHGADCQVHESAVEHSSNDYIGYSISILKLVVLRIFLAHPGNLCH